MAINKEYNDIQLDVKFTQASARANLVSEENISVSFGKISKYFADLHSQAFTGYTHPSHTAYPSGLYKVTVDGLGHVISASTVTGSDLPAHTHSNYVLKTGDTMSGNLTFAVADGSDTSGIVFKRGNFTDSTLDWKIYNSSGALMMDRTVAGDTETWQNKFKVDGTGIWYGGTQVSLVGHTHNYAGSNSAGGSALTVYGTLTNPSGQTSYAIPFHTDISSGDKSLLNNDGIVYTCKQGTASDTGFSIIELGNAIDQGTAGNKYGLIRLYSRQGGGKYVQLYPTTKLTANRNIVFPNAAGTVALLENIPTVNDASLTLKGDGTDVVTFTANSSTDKSFNITAGSNITITPIPEDNDGAGSIQIASSHPTITKSADTTSTPAQLSHGGTFTAITSVTREGNGHVTKINTATYTLPAQYTHPTYTRTDTTSTASPAHGGTFTVIDSVTATNGHVTAVNVKTVTLPSDQNTDTKVTQSETITSDFRPLLLGKNNQTDPENLETTVTDQTYVTKHVFVQPSTGNLTLYNASGDSPSLIFRRGTMIDNTLDWRIQNVGGKLNFDRDKNESTETWENIFQLDPTNNKMYFKNTEVSLSGHTHSQYLPKTTYEWNKEISFGNSGYLKIGSFPMYDTNITIDINATTSKTYHGTVVIATQNVSTTSMGSHKIHVYDDPTGNIATSLRIVWTSGSRNYDIYFVPQSWSKNFIHIRALGNYMADATDICISQTGTAPATTSGLEPVNILSVTSTGNGNAVTNVEIDSVGNLAVTKGSTFLTSHQSVTDGNPILSWGNQSTVATIGSTNIHVTMPSNPNTDTKVTSTANHYTPATVSGQDKTASASGATAAWSIDVVKGVTLNTDGKGHVTGISVTSGKIPGNPIPSYNVTGSAAWTAADRILVTNAASGNVIKQSSYTIATSVPANALFTDELMTQTNTTGSADYRVLLSGNANDTTETTTGRKSTNLKFNPSTGVLSASSGVTTKTITRSALKGMLTGSGTAAQDKGSGVSPRYFPAKWTFNTGLTAVNGDVFIIKLPTAGHSYGVFLSIDNGTNYYPISVNGTTRLTTHYGNGYSIAVMFKSDGSTDDVFPLAGGDSRSTVTGGCWQVLNYFDSGNTNTKVTQTADNSSNSDSYELLISNSANNTTETAGVRKSSRLRFNPSNGRVIMQGPLIVRATDGVGSYDEGIRINAGKNGYSTLTFGGGQDTLSGTADGQFWVGTNSTNNSYKRKLYIAHAGSTGSETYFYVSSASQVSPALKLGTSGAIANGDEDAVSGGVVYAALGNYVPNTQAGINAAINLLSEGTSNPQLADYYISQYANGGTTTTTYHRRPISALWNTFKSLITVGTTGSGNAVTSVSIANDGNNRKITFTKGSTFLTSHQTITTGSTNGTISVAGTDVAVKGLGTAAYTASTDYVPNTKSGVISAINLLDEASANIASDNAHFISEENDGSTTNYYRRKFSGLWGYINGKISATNTGTGNAVTSISYSNGVISATKGSTFSTSDHTHGNITSGGALQTTDITIASGDKLVVTDSSNSNKVARASISFDGSTTSKFLTQKGTWVTPPDTKNTAGSTDTSSKIFLIGATSQAANPQTYSDNEVYTTSGVLTTKKVQVGGGSCTMEYNSTTQSLDFVFA